jgi:hypothetical protein
MNIKYENAWSMPNSQTFLMLPIKMFLMKYINAYHEEHKGDLKFIVDPFAGESRNMIEILGVLNLPYIFLSNDLNPEAYAIHHLDALDFMHIIQDNWADIVIFDPPYSPRQVAECYEQIGRKTTQQDTQSKFWGDCKKEIARISKPNGIVFSFGWNGNGIGKTLGFTKLDGIIVDHGGNHNSTIGTVERNCNVL